MPNYYGLITHYDNFDDQETDFGVQIERSSGPQQFHNLGLEGNEEEENAKLDDFVNFDVVVIKYRYCTYTVIILKYSSLFEAL